MVGESPLVEAIQDNVISSRGQVRHESHERCHWSSIRFDSVGGRVDARTLNRGVDGQLLRRVRVK